MIWAHSVYDQLRKSMLGFVQWCKQTAINAVPLRSWSWRLRKEWLQVWWHRKQTVVHIALPGSSMPCLGSASTSVWWTSQWTSRTKVPRPVWHMPASGNRAPQGPSLCVPLGNQMSTLPTLTWSRWSYRALTRTVNATSSSNTKVSSNVCLQHSIVWSGVCLHNLWKLKSITNDRIGHGQLATKGGFTSESIRFNQTALYISDKLTAYYSLWCSVYGIFLFSHSLESSLLHSSLQLRGRCNLEYCS